ncbi:gastrula zinc finger protein XlCGF53.1-like [Uranotaenia lowii]|uniref:gastrula zinc finger protein XlCGF53.1-like n=1 Tax=Uranotaenia lowii TaxID=190385 RepID=UPI00247A2E0E|nr:gastrula zinc finger protein XlCGF53.1-like [Uranotaenia lowii]
MTYFQVKETNQGWTETCVYGLDKPLQRQWHVTFLDDFSSQFQIYSATGGSYLSVIDRRYETSHFQTLTVEYVVQPDRESNIYVPCQQKDVRTGKEIISNQSSQVSINVDPILSTANELSYKSPLAPDLTTTKNNKTCQPTAFSCPECQKRFYSKGGLTQHHKAKHTELQSTKHRCTVCGKRFRTEDQLQKHTSRHQSEEKEFACPVCPKQFHWYQDLERHHVVKHGVSRYTCTECGKKFGRADHLAGHERSHQLRVTRRLKSDIGLGKSK